MAFGQAAGPPATARQVRELSDLLEAAGHDGFRDARGPLGFTQRQAAGKFTRDEAQTFIDQLEAATCVDALASLPQQPSVRHASTRPMRAATFRATPVVHLSPAERAARALTNDQLLAEVRRRGLTGES